MLFGRCARAKNSEMREPVMAVSSFSWVIAGTVSLPFATAIVLAGFVVLILLCVVV